MKKPEKRTTVHTFTDRLFINGMSATSDPARMLVSYNSNVATEEGGAININDWLSCYYNMHNGFDVKINGTVNISISSIDCVYVTSKFLKIVKSCDGNDTLMSVALPDNPMLRIVYAERVPVPVMYIMIFEQKDFYYPTILEPADDTYQFIRLSASTPPTPVALPVDTNLDSTMRTSVQDWCSAIQEYTLGHGIREGMWIAHRRGYGKIIKVYEQEIKYEHVYSLTNPLPEKEVRIAIRDLVESKYTFVTKDNFLWISPEDYTGKLIIGGEFYCDVTLPGIITSMIGEAFADENPVPTSYGKIELLTHMIMKSGAFDGLGNHGEDPFDVKNPINIIYSIPESITGSARIYNYLYHDDVRTNDTRLTVEFLRTPGPGIYYWRRKYLDVHDKEIDLWED